MNPNMEDLISEKVLQILFINKETEGSRDEKKCTSSLQKRSNCLSVYSSILPVV